MEPLSFFGRLVQKLKVLCFTDSFVQKATQQSDGSCNVAEDFSIQIFQKTVFSILKTQMKIHCE